MKYGLLALLVVASCTQGPPTPEPDPRRPPDSVSTPVDSVYDEAQAQTDSIAEVHQDTVISDSTPPVIIKDSILPDTAQSYAPEPEIRALAARKPSTPQVKRVQWSIVTYKPDTSRMYAGYELTRGLSNGDTVVIRFARSATTGVPALASQTALRFKTVDSVAFATPRIYGKRASYWTCSYMRRKGREINHKCAGWDTTWPPQEDPTLVIVRIDVKPDKAEVAPDSSQQFCGFMVFADGKVAMRNQDVQACGGEYGKLPIASRSVSPAQQSMANAQCITWTATGGTIAVDICSVPPGGQSRSNRKRMPWDYYLDHQMPAAVAEAILRSVRQ